MPAMTRYVHTNVAARDWRDGLTSLKNAHVRGMHLRLPGHGAAGPTLEIFEYSPRKAAGPPCVNRPGFARIAFSIPDVKQALLAVKRSGGSSVGTLVDAGIEGVGRIDVVYARDPEGNIIELQRWDRGTGGKKAVGRKR
jgi:hypothetical protein